MIRAVIDTNVIISAYLGGSLEKILSCFIQDKFSLILSKPIADEYFSVLKRPKFQIQQDEFDDFVSLLVRKSEFVIPIEPINIIHADPSDNKFLEAAIDGKADCIVSGDSHLLEVKIIHEIPIITPREFIEMLSTI